MNSKSYDLIRRKSKGHFLAYDFSKLKQLAKTTIGHSNQFLLSELKVVLDIYFQMDSKIKEIEKQILDLVNSLKPSILTIPGIGYLSAATILSEFGDFSRFKSPSKMLAFAGLEPSFFQSGTYENSGKMVKHGSPYLRYALMNCCLPLINSDIVFADYYAKKRSEGKPYRVALTHVAKKLLRVIYTIQTKNVPYDRSLIR